MANKSPKVLVISQNIFIALTLGFLLDRTKQTDCKTLLVPSNLEKNIISFLSLFKSNVKVVSLGAFADNDKKDKPLSSYKDTVEFKRGSVSQNTLEPLMKNLENFLTSEQDFCQIWIYNQWTWIATVLKGQHLSNKTIVFESANYENAICVMGDLNSKNSELLRKKIRKMFDKNSYEKLDTKVTELRRFRVASVIVSVFLRGGAIFYASRLLVSRLNQLIAFVLDKLPIKKGECLGIQNRKVLVILQIENDSEILRYGTQNDYRKNMIKAITKELEKNIHIVVRPHPKDYTFGWLKIYSAIKRANPNTSLSLGPEVNLNLDAFDHYYTYSSNFIRKLTSKSQRKKLSIIRSAPVLDGADIFGHIIYKNLLK